MIVFNPSNLNLTPNEESKFIEMRTIFGKVIYRIEREKNNLNMERQEDRVGYRFQGHYDYLKIHRNTDILSETFKVELVCPNCKDKAYNLTGKLPFVFILKTDFDVTKDTSKG